MNPTQLFGSLLPGARRRVLGLDIGTDGARLVMLRRSRDQYTVEWVEEISLTEFQGFADYDTVVEKIEAVVQERVRGRVDVATVPPWSSARISIEEMPKMDGERFAKAANWYFSRTHTEDMAHPVHHAVAQAPRRTLEGTEVLDGMMISMDEIMVDGLHMLCRRLGLRLRWLLPPPLCHAPLLRLCGRANQRLLLLDIGSGQTRMTLLLEGHVRLVRKLKPCANDVLRKVGEEAGLGWEQAGQALQAHSGLGPLAGEDPEGIAARASAAVERALDRVIQQLQDEVERSRAYIQARHGEDVDAVLVTGGLGGSEYLISRLREGLECTVQAVDPFRSVQLNAEVPDAARCHFTLAVGAAMQVFEGAEETNILASVARRSNKVRRRPRLTAQRLLPAGLAAGLVLGVGAYDLRQSLRSSELATNVERLQQQHEELRATADELANQRDLFDLEDRIESLRDIYNSRQLHTPFFSRVVGCLPEGLWLQALAVSRDVEVDEAEPEPEYDENGEPVAPTLTLPTLPPLRVHLEGHAEKVESIGQLVLALETERLLQAIEVLDIREAADDEENSFDGYSFEIQGTPIVGRQDEDLAARTPEAR